MTLQINVDPSGLTQSQREALAGFILAYPGKECAGTCGKGEHERPSASDVAENVKLCGEVEKDARSATISFPPIVTAPEKAAVLVKSIADDFAANVLNPAVAQLAQDDADFDAAQAFGSTPAPLPPGAVASSTAVVAPLPIAPVATPVTTSITPPPAPPVPAPTTSGVVPVPPAPAAPTNPVDLDKNGLPWDYRIHAESKAKIADGTWRKKRGADPALIVTVEDELRQLMGAPSPAAPGVASQNLDGSMRMPTGVAPSVPLPPAAPLAAPATTIATPGPASLVAPAIATPTVTVPSHPSAPGVASPIPAAPSAAVDPKAQFVQLVGKAAAAINAGKVTKEQVNAACAAHGVAQLVLLASRLDLVPTVAAEIYKLIGE